MRILISSVSLRCSISCTTQAAIATIRPASAGCVGKTVVKQHGLL
jgi:hypothetical protein